MSDELNPRQQALVAQVKAGDVTETEPDTEDQLLSLARQGHLAASYGPNGWSFELPGGSKPRASRSRSRKKK
jgi:hypothetical protein